MKQNESKAISVMVAFYMRLSLLYMILSQLYMILSQFYMIISLPAPSVAAAVFPSFVIVVTLIVMELKSKKTKK